MTTEDKSTHSSLTRQNQRRPNQYQRRPNQSQNNQMDTIIKQLSDSGYKVTKEYSDSGKLSGVSGESPLRKTWWDWADLLIVPLLIFFLGIGFTWIQYLSSNQIAQENPAHPTGCATCMTFRHRHRRRSRLIETAKVLGGKGPGRIRGARGANA